MADIWYDTSATGLNDGSSRANAFTDLQSALTAYVAGDFLLWVENSYFSFSSTQAYTCPNSKYYDPIVIKIVSSTTDTYAPKPETPQLENIGWNLFSWDFQCIVYGMHISIGRIFYLDFHQDYVHLVDCKLTFNPTSSASLAAIYANNVNSPNTQKWDNVDIKATSVFLISCNLETVEMNGGSIDLEQSNSGQGIFSIGSKGADISINGVDISNAPLAENLVFYSAAAYAYASDVKFNGCSLPTGVPVVSGIVIPGQRVQIIGSDTGAYDRYELYTLFGTLISTTAAYVDSSEPHIESGDKYSLELTPTLDPLSARTDNLHRPFESEFMAVYAEAGAKTLTLELNHDMALALKDAQIWFDVFYADSVDVKVKFDTTYNAALKGIEHKDPFSAGADLPASTEAWTGIAGTKQKIVKSLTLDRSGFLYVKVYCSAYEPGTSIFMNSEIKVT